MSRRTTLEGAIETGEHRRQWKKGRRTEEEEGVRTGVLVLGVVLGDLLRNLLLGNVEHAVKGTVEERVEGRGEQMTRSASGKQSRGRVGRTRPEER